MKGGIISIAPYNRPTDLTFTPVEGEPKLELLKNAIGGGYIELVPGFDTIEQKPGEVVKCVAFCDEEGKLNGLPANTYATILWDKALRRHGGPGLLQRDGTAVDVLVGPIAIVIGDDEFMEAL
jgi:hypothetical protein